jgi:hypothetical protein
MRLIFGGWITVWVVTFPTESIAQQPHPARSPLTCPQGSSLVEETGEEENIGEWCEKEGIREGPYRLWAHGVLRRAGEFNKGQMTGVWRRYTDKGRLTDEGAWNENRPDGVWSFYDSTGRMVDRVLFNKGERVSTKPDTWIWKRGQLMGARIFQKSGGQVGTAFLSFVPGKKRGPLTEWVGAISLGGLKSRDPVKPLVWVLSASAGMRFRINGLESFRFEPRIGAHSWIGSAIAPSLHLDSGYELVPGRAAIVGGIERVSFKVNQATLLRVGFEYRFGD